MFKISDILTVQLRDTYLGTAAQKKSLETENCDFRLSIITQFYPPDYAATGQLIQELATQLGKNNIEVNVFTGQPGYVFNQKDAPAKEQLEKVNVLYPSRKDGYRLYHTGNLLKGDRCREEIMLFLDSRRCHRGLVQHS